MVGSGITGGGGFRVTKILIPGLTAPVSLLLFFCLLPSAAQSPSIQRFIQLVSFFIRLKLRLSPTEFFFYLTKRTFFLA